MTASAQTFHLGLIGWPLGHSLSPIMHAAALQAAGLAGEYGLFPVPGLPEGTSGLQALVEDLRRGKLHGLNVTIPHKQHVLSLLDELTPAARAIGAVNTIACVDGRLLGDNTDWLGFSRDLAARLPGDLPAHFHRQALVLGAGGAARAVVYALLQAGWQVNLAARRVEQSRQLAAELFTPEIKITTDSPAKFQQLPAVRLIVNTTPLGMSPQVDDSPWPVDLPFPPKALLYDLIYNPLETRLMKAAQAAGLPTANGLGMLAEQAALAFEIWTGCSVPAETFRKAARERMPL